MNWSAKQIGEAALDGLAIVAVLAGLVLWYQRINEKKALLIRLAISTVPVGLIWFVVLPMSAKGGLEAVAALFFTVALGWIMAIIWVPAVTGYVGRLFGSLYDGGDTELEAKPYFSIFRAKRTRGKYFEALAEIRRQLDKFPTDFEGQILLAELQAENLNDLPGAEITIHRLCNQKEHSLTNKSYALNKLADWHLSLTKDRESAQRALEKIIELMPDSEMSLRASQRIGHLADTDMLIAAHDRGRIEVKKGVKSLGLRRGEDGRLKAPEVDQEKLALEYTAHLEQHPQDTHVREKLAIIYAKHYHRLDLALDQLEQLIQQPGHAARHVAHWLNLMADLQVHEASSVEEVRATLQRIIDLLPESAAAATALRRMDMLKLEMKATTAGPAVQLGTYEQDIGLKRKQ